MTTSPTTEKPLPHTRTPGTARAALAYPEFRILFTGMALSSIGTWVEGGDQFRPVNANRLF